jgi:hypothetical protein
MCSLFWFLFFYALTKDKSFELIDITPLGDLKVFTAWILWIMVFYLVMPSSPSEERSAFIFRVLHTPPHGITTQ